MYFNTEKPKCEGCGYDEGELAPLLCEGEDIGAFCSECHRVVTMSLLRLKERPDLNLETVVLQERNAIVELCRQLETERTD